MLYRQGFVGNVDGFGGNKGGWIIWKTKALARVVLPKEKDGDM